MVTNNTLRNVVRNSYYFDNFQIVGGPELVRQEPGPDHDQDINDNLMQPQFQAMVQALLADWFKLVVHRERAQAFGQAIAVARADGRLGPRLSRSTTDCAAIRDGAPRGTSAAVRSDGRPLCGTRT